MSLRKCLYINFTADGRSGGGKYNETVLDILRELSGRVDVLTFPMDVSRWRNLKSTVAGYLNGMTAGFARTVLEQLGREAYDVVFLASSNFGKLARMIREKHRGVKICVLFNNIEQNFIRSQLSVGFKPQLLLTLVATYFSERNVVRSADRIIVLNDREAGELRRLYGREADAVIPIVLKDEWRDGGDGAHGRRTDGTLTGLFVGSNFYANKHAVEWFAANVAPRLRDTVIQVVGRGFEAERHLESGVMRIIGSVGSLEEYYAASDFVIAPVFKGAGMKVKVAEAMMYGRTVLGTPEAFEGYGDVAGCGVVCLNAADFISAINNRSFTVGFNKAARDRFLRYYDYGAVKGQVEKLLNM